MDEVSFLERLYSQWNPGQKYEIYSYRTNIHILSQILCSEYPDFETNDIDIRLVLRSREKDDDRRRILQEKYRDIYLIFDFEPQHNCPHFDIVRRMMGYFQDSTNQGKLFVNYPMMQSYKDFSALPDDSFKERSILVDKVKDYKQHISKTSCLSDPKRLQYSTFVSIAVHHLRKANWILTGEYKIPEVENYLRWNGQDVFDKQVQLVNDERLVWILNTSVFLLVDYSPNRFFEGVKRKRQEFDI